MTHRERATDKEIGGAVHLMHFYKPLWMHILDMGNRNIRLRSYGIKKDGTPFSIDVDGVVRLGEKDENWERLIKEMENDDITSRES